VSGGVEERPLPPARAVGGADPANERGWIVTRGGGRQDGRRARRSPDPSRRAQALAR
jgi:hypothetical protein